MTESVRPATIRNQISERIESTKSTNNNSSMMKMKEMNLKSPARARYSSPGVRVMKVESRGMLCGSERQSALNSTEMEEGDDNW